MNVLKGISELEKKLYELYLSDKNKDFQKMFFQYLDLKFNKKIYNVISYLPNLEYDDIKNEIFILFFEKKFPTMIDSKNQVSCNMKIFIGYLNLAINHCIDEILQLNPKYKLFKRLAKELNKNLKNSEYLQLDGQILKVIKQKKDISLKKKNNVLGISNKDVENLILKVLNESGKDEIHYNDAINLALNYLEQSGFINIQQEEEFVDTLDGRDENNYKPVSSYVEDLDNSKIFHREIYNSVKEFYESLKDIEKLIFYYYYYEEKQPKDLVNITNLSNANISYYLKRLISIFTSVVTKYEIANNDDIKEFLEIFRKFLKNDNLIVLK